MRYSLSIFAAGAAIRATGADSLTVAGGDVFVGYANGLGSPHGLAFITGSSR